MTTLPPLNLVEAEVYFGRQTGKTLRSVLRTIVDLSEGKDVIIWNRDGIKQGEIEYFFNKLDFALTDLGLPFTKVSRSYFVFSITGAEVRYVAKNNTIGTKSRDPVIRTSI